jgi:membrane protease YdiL (CAAX protease family)
MRRLAIAVVAVVIWAIITVWGGLLQSGHGSLGALVSRQVTIATPVAALFLLLVARFAGWRDLGLNGPRPPGSAWLLWPIGVYVVAFAGLASLNHHPALPALAFIAINTAFVGFSEELAFRGVLWGAARKAMGFWPGVLLVSGLFGSVHVLNAFITGQMGEAGVQALNAFLSGICYLALRIRTRSLLPIMVGHWLWDLAVFLSASDSATAAAQPSGATRLLAGAVLVVPITLYGLWLLRRPEFRVMVDDVPERPASNDRS